MDFAIHLGSLNPRIWAEAAEAGDRLGFESLWVPEHLVIPVRASGSPHAGAEHPPIPAEVPVYDAFTLLGFLAARTSRIGLGTNVYNIGLRHPFVTARGATTVDVLSGGRLMLGIGASWLREEWEAVGLDFDRRGKRVDEAIEVCQRLWREPVIEHHGEFFDFDPVAFEPKPLQPGGVPLHVGGDGPAALRRAATVGAGWMPMNHTLAEMPAAIGRLRQLCEQAGRHDAPQVTVNGEVADDGDVDRYAAAGVTRLIVRPWTRSREAVEGMERFASRFIAG